MCVPYFRQSAYWHTGAYFGEGLGEIVASGLQCNGDENTIGSCGGSWLATSSCHHSDDVSVSCDGSKFNLRLVGQKAVLIHEVKPLGLHL